MHPRFHKYHIPASAVIITLLLNGLLFSSSIAAQSAAPASTASATLAPANDEFANAQVLVGATGTVTGTTAAATKEPPEPSHARNRGNASVWYKYVAIGNSVLTVDTIGSGFDTTLAVYRGGYLEQLKLVAENDDANQSIRSQVIVGIETNEVLYIAVDGYYNTTTGVGASGALQLNYSVANVAANDNFANARTLPFISGKLISTSNVGASKESGEPTIYNNSGGKSLWFKWIAPAGGPKSMTFAVESDSLSHSYGVTALCAIYSGTSLGALTYVQATSVTNLNRPSFIPVAGTTYYLIIDGFDHGTGAETGTFTINYGPTKDGKSSDFDRDGRADLAVYRPSTGSWYSQDTITDKLRSMQFGANGDLPMLADLGDDAKLDYIVYRQDTGIWYVLDSELGFRADAWGVSGDIPFVRNNNGFYNSYSIFRPGTGVWWNYFYILGVGSGGQPWGANGDLPISADFQGYGFDQDAVFRPSNGTWYSHVYSTLFPPVKFGQSGDKPVPADYDGDGVADYAVFRPSAGVWYIQFSSTGAVNGIQWGVSTDVPQPADYDGDGKADIAVFRNGTWYIRLSSNLSLRVVQFGLPGDIPLAAPIH